VRSDARQLRRDQKEKAMTAVSTRVTGHVLAQNMYMNGEYQRLNPHWHIEESAFKAKHILKMMEKNRLQPKAICEVGCGAGEVLKLLQERMDDTCRFWGYDISPHALELCKSRVNERLQFRLADICREEDTSFDLILVLDVIEHVQDYYGFLDGIRRKGKLKIFHIPLDVSVQAVVRKNGLLRRREMHGHIQYFTKETALETLRDVGYQVLDYCFTPRCIDLGQETIQKIVKLPRMICFAIHQELTVRILGGYSLLVLAT